MNYLQHALYGGLVTVVASVLSCFYVNFISFLEKKNLVDKQQKHPRTTICLMTLFLTLFILNSFILFNITPAGNQIMLADVKINYLCMKNSVSKLIRGREL